MKIKFEKASLNGTQYVVVEMDRIETLNLIEKLIATFKQTKINPDAYHCLINCTHNRELLFKIVR